MEANYTTIDETEVYVNEEQICLAIDDPENAGYTIVTMSSGDRLSVKAKESNEVNEAK